LAGKQADITSLTDRELVLSYQQNDDTAIIGELYKRYSHLVFGVCLKYLKNKEESQDAVIRIFEKLMTDLRTNDVLQFRGWLHTVTRNHCLMHLRKYQKIQHREKDIAAVEHSLAYEPDDEKEQTEKQLTEMEAAMELLKPAQKQCLELFYLQGKCYQDVADITGFELKKVKSYIQNGKRNLKILLTQNNVTSLDK